MIGLFLPLLALLLSLVVLLILALLLLLLLHFIVVVLLLHFVVVAGIEFATPIDFVRPDGGGVDPDSPHHGREHVVRHHVDVGARLGPGNTRQHRHHGRNAPHRAENP